MNWRWVLEPVCWLLAHKKVDLSVNGRLSGMTWCDRCGAKWWRGRRKRRWV